MLIITGADSLVLDHLAEALSRAGRAFVRGELKRPLGPEEPGLFELALARHATTVVLVESLARPTATAPPPHPELLAEALRAARAPGVSLLVVVTARAADDVGLDTIRRSGTPYVILSAPVVASLPDACARKFPHPTLCP